MKQALVLLLIIACGIGLVSCVPYQEFTLAPLPESSAALQAVWTVRPAPVLGRGQAGTWDAVDVLNPSVVSRSGFFNFYSGFDGRTWHTGLATSADGREWVKRGKVLSPDAGTWEGNYIAANGSALADGGSFVLWYQAGNPVPSIGRASSKDGMHWTKDPAPVLRPGPFGSWDERGVADPYVIRQGATLFLYYLGQDRAHRQRLGLARSVDGKNWTKLRTNPVLDLGEPGSFDETGLGEPAVWKSQGSYWMLYTARDRREWRRLGLARSHDGVHWSRLSLQPTLAGMDAWNAKVVCDPHVELSGDAVRVWFGGGDRAEPAENLNGQIGEAELRLVPATLAK